MLIIKLKNMLHLSAKAQRKCCTIISRQIPWNVQIQWIQRSFTQGYNIPLTNANESLGDFQTWRCIWGVNLLKKNVENANEPRSKWRSHSVSEFYHYVHTSCSQSSTNIHNGLRNYSLQFSKLLKDGFTTLEITQNSKALLCQNSGIYEWEDEKI